MARTVFEVVSAAAVAAGVGIEVGAGWGVTVAGVLGMFLSWMAGGDE